MSMDLEDLAVHIAQVRHDLESKKRLVELMLFTDPEQAMRVRYQINCLEPRLRELERSALRAGKEQQARLAVAPV